MSEGKVITSTPVSDKYRQNLKVANSYITQRNLEGNPLVKNVYLPPKNSGIPSDMITVPVPIPLEKTNMHSNMEIQLAEMLSSGYAHIHYDDVTHNEADMVAGEKFFFPNGRSLNNYLVISDSYILLTFKDRIEDGRKKNEERTDRLFQGAIVDKGEAATKGRPSSVSESINVTHGEENYKTFSDIRVEDLLENVPLDADGKRDPQVLENLLK